MTTEDSGTPAATAEDHPRSTNPNWPALLEKYRALAQADWDATRESDARDKDASKKTVRRLERAIDEANDRLEDIVSTIAGTEGNSLEALAVKLAIEWSHHVDFPDLSKPMSSEQLLIRTSLDYLVVQTGLDLFVCHDRNGRWLLGRFHETPEDDPSESYLEGDYPEPTSNADAPLIALELECANLRAKAAAIPHDKRSDAFHDQAADVEHEIAETRANSPVGISIKLRLLDSLLEASKSPSFYQSIVNTSLEALDRMDDVNLILMEQEHNWRYFETNFPEDSKEADENTDRIAVLAREIASHPAHTAIGAMVKLRVMRAYQRHSECDWYEVSWDTALEALRLAGIGGAS